MMTQEPKINSKQLAYYTDYNISLPDLCSELSYFVIFDFPHNQQNEEIRKKKPVVVTYRNEDITFKQILQRFCRLKKDDKYRVYIKFTLSKGYRVPMKSTVLDLKKNLRKSNLDGVVLFTKQIGQDEESDSEEESEFQNECGLMQFIGLQPQFDQEQKFTFHFILPKCKNIISIKINPSNRVQQLIEDFSNEVIKEFKIFLEKEDIQEFKIKNKDISLKSKDIIADVKGLYDQSYIEVIMQNSSIKFEKKVQEENMITIIKEYISHKTLKKQQKKLVKNYEEIKNMQISVINERYFLEENEKENKNNPICLKVMQFIIKGWQKLNKLDYAINKLKELGDVKLVGYLINEKMVFYKQIPQILKTKDAKQFTLQQLQIPHQSVKERTKCDEMINERLNEIEEEYFQDKRHVQPIFVYTSNLKFKDKVTGKITKIYDALNWSLRNQSILLKNTLQICEQWVYRYTSTLLRHLSEIPGENCKVYRGVNYNPQGKKGDLITFKPFTSTSKQIRVAVNFALQEYTKDPTLPLTIFQMQIFQGKPIDKLSYYSTQKQILLQPFTEFLITDNPIKRRNRFPYFQGTPQFDSMEGSSQYIFQIYKLRQINSPKQMPKTINNYILWIDNKPNEGKQTFNRFIQEFRFPTVLFQIPSTLKLQQWINQRQNIINDQSSKLIMITNMVRTQQKGLNYYAGVESINLIREYLPNINIAVYVRDTKASQRNLDDKNVNMENLVVISQFQELSKFVEQHIEVKFRSIFPNQPVESHAIKCLSSTEHAIPHHGPTLQKKSKSQFSKSEKGKCQIM